jgi:hypothetical protein
VPSIQITYPSFVPSHKPAPGHKPSRAHAPGRGAPVNAESDLITLVAADEIYRAEHGSYTDRVSALETQPQFRVNPQGDYQIGLGGGNYCMVGRETNTAWRLYDEANPTSIATTYAGRAAAMRACSVPVRWG